MDDMLKLYLGKRREYESKIRDDLSKIEDSVLYLTEVGDYFSIKTDDALITLKAIMADNQKHIGISANENSKIIPFSELTLTEHPDLILWIIQNDALIEQGFKEVLINAVRNGENIINTLKELKANYE